MRALLTPEVAPMTGVVIFRPGSELMHLFRRGRVLIEPQTESMAELPSGLLPETTQELQNDPLMRDVFENQKVIHRAGGLNSLDAWLERKLECQYPHSEWHDRNYTITRHAPGSIRTCWGCDLKIRDQFTEGLAGIARENLVSWLLKVVNGQFGFSEDHVLTLPEFCWWMVRSDLADEIPEAVAHKALRMKKESHQSVTRESDIVPALPAQQLVQEKAKKIVAMKVDPETPESFMLKPKRRRWVNEKYTRWVKAQPCACCNKQADDPHHLIGHGQGGMGTKAHDLFVIPLCREHHDELHADPVAFEAKYGDQLVLVFRVIDRALAIGVLA
ncbi:TPA: DUF968 domain-containing protein [Citrobacter freundii]|uniref:DUF968 domain-containing protein n=3 Tax=Citrobacter freundii complex TaxID=1344959 RepID=A0AAI9HFJ4_CITFR|nr:MULTISPECIES: DUF968 domain-containing protein [Citrobacter]EKV7199221.1 DUF968 domain-containing protein [Citrobacter freundii]EKW4405765.1 DUF968 domain-containing protein [Citrobacter freundii]EKX8774771.1 DUF968 domain-containing protein [Citrobacter freundii]ELF4152761.1 DUF968 domain-containing protein [Citrobacter freundii]ELJ5788412.1 DUF968 domain-containing protein [Citrobacter freundii]